MKIEKEKNKFSLTIEPRFIVSIAIIILSIETKNNFKQFEILISILIKLVFNL